MGAAPLTVAKEDIKQQTQGLLSILLICLGVIALSFDNDEIKGDDSSGAG
jgi:hypothetical protein